MSETMSPLPDENQKAALPDQDQKVAAVDTSAMKKPSIKKFMKAKKTRVLVLGAGMSGLACALELQQRGYRVVVVEARDRPGGRLKGGVKTNDKEGGNEGMKTLPSSIVSPDNVDIKAASKSRNKKETTTPIDLGGALIHGIENNPIYALAQQMGIPTQAVSECLLFNETGWPVDTKEDERISALFNECLEETFDRVAKADTAGSEKPPANTASTAEAAATPASNEAPSEPAKASASTSKKTNDTPDETTKPQREEEAIVEEGGNSPPSLSEDNEEAKEKEAIRISTRRNGKRRSNDDTAAAQPSTEEKKETRMTTRQRGKPKTNRKDEAESNTAFSPKQPVEEPEPVKSAAESEVAEPPPPSFGDVFDQVCEEKGAPRASSLFQWHQANLEVSCGASFPGLGYKWNDDEPYGFDGEHVALKVSWKPVMECMAETLDVLYQSPVKKVVMVVPDPPPEPPEPEPVASLQSPEQSAVSTPKATTTTPASLPSSKKKRKQTPTTTPLPSRKSRRLVGDDPDARRSSRANKGQKVERFNVNEFSRGSYDEKKGSAGKPKKRQQEAGTEDVHTTVQVTLEDGSVLEAEAVVCTLPLGILKLEDKPVVKPRSKSKSIEEQEDNTWDESSGAITFYPPLSERKQTAIRRLGCGLLNKCVLSFSHVFWQDSDFLGLVHPANSYLVLNAARFSNKPILTFMYGGEFAEHIESWTDNEIVGDCMEVIRIICGKRDIPAPLDYAVTRWGHERYSRMSFSYVPPGVDGMEEFKAISEAVYDPLVPKKPVIMFAGEHTTPFHPSTMHGAFFSGVREAYRLDLVVEEEANDNIEFDDEHLYQHTFGVRRLFPDASARSPVARVPPSQATSVAEPTNGPNQNIDTRNRDSTRRQHRRRGAATVTHTMNLRERPNSNQSEGTETPAAPRRARKPQQPEAERAAGQKNGAKIPARRSRRSVYSMKEEDNKNGQATALKNAPTTDQEAEIQRKRISSLESRTLMRALESYGHNYPYIHSVVLPIFGSGVPPKSLPQVRARCQQMIRSILSAASAAIPKQRLAFWLPKEVYIPPPPTPQEKKNKKAPKASNSNNSKSPSRRRAGSTPNAPVVEATRRSSRQQKQRQLMDL